MKYITAIAFSCLCLITFSSAQAETIQIRPTFYCYDKWLNSNGYKVDDETRKKLLTKEAFDFGIQIYRSASDEAKYGSVTLLYLDKKSDCVYWRESISLQEYSSRVGLSPIGISPFYSEETK